jgi:hypothetical protein
MLNQGSAEKETGGKGRKAKQVVLKQHANKGRNANQVVLKQHANKGRNANWTDTKGNRTLELVRKQLKKDGRKMEPARKRTKNWNRTKIARDQRSRN